MMQEIVNAMNAPGGTIDSIHNAMYIHPATPEVVQRASTSLRRAGNVENHEQQRNREPRITRPRTRTPL